MLKPIKILVTLCLLSVCSGLLQARPLLEFIPPPSSESPRIILIIDDIGDNKTLGQRAVELPGKVTLAFLPHTPNASQLAENAHHLGKEIMLHMPMSNINNQALGPGGLTPRQAKPEFIKTLKAALKSIPHLQGINNHMGSELTQLEQPMKWVMEELGCHDLYFVDSRTSPKSVAFSSARGADIAHLRRDVFLDNEKDPRYIAEAFDRLVRIAKRYGVAVGIGHPYPETLAYLEQVVPHLDAMGIELSYPSQVLHPYQPLSPQRHYYQDMQLANKSQ
jgi:hypothetical protein